MVVTEHAPIICVLTPSFQEIAGKCEGYSGADLQALLYAAQIDAVHSVIASGGDKAAACAASDTDRMTHTTTGAALSFNDELRVRAACDPSRPWMHPPEVWHTIASLGSGLPSSGGAEDSSLHRDPPCVERHHLEEALRSTRPSISEEERRSREKAFLAFSSANEDTQVDSGSATRITHM